MKKQKAYFHLPGLFEFYELYRRFLPLFYEHREYFYEWCEIGSVYGAPAGCIWAGGRTGLGTADGSEVIALMKKYGISARLTLSNSQLKEQHLSDPECHALCAMFHDKRNGIIVHSDLLLSCLQKKYPDYYYISSTTKVITDFTEFRNELQRPEFRYVVPDFRLNRRFEELNELSQGEKEKVEFLVNECCWTGCSYRKRCYENVSLLNLGKEEKEHICRAPDAREGYRFSKAMRNPSFISADDIRNVYLPAGFSQFKIEGRTLGSALILEFLLYYMTKPEYQICVREELYLDNMLDLF